MVEKSNLDLLNELGVETKVKPKAAYTAREERIIAGFEEVQRFVEENGRTPQHGEGNDIFERLYAIRLDQIHNQEDSVELLKVLDHQNLLISIDGNHVAEPPSEYSSNRELLETLGVAASEESDITQLKYIKPRAEIRAAEEIAQRMPCSDFDKFSAIFETVQNELTSGLREAKLLVKSPRVDQGDLFVLNGQKLYIAESGEEFKNQYDRNDRRLRVIYDNGTESALLFRSLQRALEKDGAGRRILNISAGPLFDRLAGEDDLASGTIYVLRSKSDHSLVVDNQKVIHKIGVTGGDVERRIVNAKVDPTFLMADVEVVATYDLFNINRNKLEKLIHRFFESAKLDLEIPDRFGNPVKPQEWFLAPLSAIDRTVDLIKDGSISEFYYDLAQASVVRHEN